MGGSQKYLSRSKNCWGEGTESNFLCDICLKLKYIYFQLKIYLSQAKNIFVSSKRNICLKLKIASQEQKGPKCWREGTESYFLCDGRN